MHLHYNKKIITAAASGIFLLLLLTIAGCSHNENRVSSGTAKPDSTHAAAGSSGPQAQQQRKILYWQAPMDPTEIYDHPGKSKMGMDLIPVYADQAKSSGGTVVIDPVTIQNMDVRYTTVKRMDFYHEIRASGIVTYNEQNLYTVSNKISGWIDKLYIDYTGQMVRKGQPLMEIYSPELVTTQQEYLLALRNQEASQGSDIAAVKEGAQSLLASARERLDNWDIPQSEITRLEKTGKVRKTLQLDAPTSGVVIQKNAVNGAHVAAGTDLYRIANLSTVWIEAGIYDYELPWINTGQEATATLSYLPGKSYSGKISYIYPYLDQKSRTVKVRIQFANPGLELRPGMYGSVYIKGKTIPNTLVIPSESVIHSGERDVVFVARGNGKFEPREVHLGVEGGPQNGYVQVLGGLLEVEKIVTSGQFLIDSESRLQEAIQKMLEQKQGKPSPSSMEQQPMPGMKSSGKMQMSSPDTVKMNMPDQNKNNGSGQMNMKMEKSQ
ncbi:MAG: efflux RND transporter periplasmic adaptor subunit [Calditrichia bacterium]